MALCRSCGAEIKFIKLKSGRWNPVNPTKRYLKKDGGKEVLITDSGDVIMGTFMSLEDGANGEGYTSHFATCPGADQFRR